MYEPTLWLDSAKRLWRAGDLLYRLASLESRWQLAAHGGHGWAGRILGAIRDAPGARRFASMAAPDRLPPPVNDTAIMLLALAVENMLKGAIVARTPSALHDAKVRADTILIAAATDDIPVPPGFEPGPVPKPTGALPEFLRSHDLPKLADVARLSLSDEERAALTHATAAIEHRGRYPIEVRIPAGGRVGPVHSLSALRALLREVLGRAEAVVVHPGP